MARRWVVNASPLILLAKIGQVALLPTLADEIAVPLAVVEEIIEGPDDDPARRLFAEGALPVVATPVPPNTLLAWDLGRGETAVLSHALANPGWSALLDDGAARRAARALDVDVLGTLAVVVLARRAGLVPSATALLHELIAHGFRIDETLLRDVLRRAVGEAWP